MELNEEAKEAVRELGDAINSAVSESERVSRALEKLREIGYQANMNLKLEIGLKEIAPVDDDSVLDETELELTDEDLKTLRNMKIKINE